MSDDDSVLDNPNLTNLKVKSKFRDGKGRDNKSGKFVKGNPGGGRPKGSVNIVSRKAADKLGEMGVDPIEFLAQIMADPEADSNHRIRAAEQLMSYAYSKQPTMTETKHDGAIPLMNVGVIPMESEEDDDQTTTH